MAGIRYQARLTLALLVRSAHGAFPATALMPEGLEDVDAVPVPGAERRFVQAKELAAADAFLGVGDLADFVAHVAPILRADPDAIGCLVTNGGFGGGLEATGWDTSLAPSSELVANIAGVLDGTGTLEVGALLRRIRLVQDSANLTAAVAELAEWRGVDPAVAQLALDRCLAVVGDAAAEQAQRSATTPVVLGLGELDAAVEVAVRVIATAAVHPEELRRVVAPLTFGDRSTMSAEEFLHGVDVRPEHIAAGLDVVRHDELDAIADALASDRLALIVGPSGSGKSALLWRTAAEHAVRMRVWRVYALTEADADMLVAAIEQQRPSSLFPVLVCVDDIGRPNRAGWRQAADALLELSGVYVVGAAREEDFAPADALRRAVIVRPKLTRKMAEGIEQVLRGRGLVPLMAVEEARMRARGLLMEFLHLMIAGRRLAMVLAEQAAALEEDAARATELAVARYVTAAHSVGLDVSGATLDRRFGGAGLAAALSRLDREHLVVESAAGVWSGLHERRSAELLALLHERPPPRTADTLTAVVEDAASEAVAARLSAVAAAAGDRASVAAAVAQRVARDPGGWAAWLEGARLADVAEHARACVAVARGLPLPPTLNVGQWVEIAGMSRFAGVDLSIVGEEFHQLAAALPRPDAQLFGTAAGAVGEDEWVRRLLAAEPADATRLLEAIESGVSWSAVAAAELGGAVPSGDVHLAARWVASVHRGCADDAARAALVVAVPAPHARLAALRDEWPLLIEADLDSGSAVARTRFIHPIDGTESPEERAAELAALVLDLLPEAAMVEVTVARYDGADLPLLGRLGPHKAIPRKNLPSQVVTRWNRAFGDSVERELEATSLTERLRQQAAAVALATEVVVGMVKRLAAPATEHRGSRRWELRRDRLERDVAALNAAPQPEAVVLAPLGSPPRARSDNAAQALEQVVTAVHQFAQAASEDGGLARQRMRIVGSQLRDAARHYHAALVAGGPRYSGEPDPLDPGLADVLATAAAVLIGYADGSDLMLPSGPLTSAALRDEAERIGEAQLAAERELLRRALAVNSGVDIDAARLVGPGEPPGMVADPRRWLLPVPGPGLGDVVDVLLRLIRATDISHPLAFRVIVAPADDGVLFSYTATVIGSNNAFPTIDGKELRALAAEAGIPVRPGRFVLEAGECVTALLRASRAAGAAAKMTGTRQEFQLRERAADELAIMQNVLDTIDVTAVGDPLRRVAVEVGEEIAGSEPGALAIEFDDALTDESIGWMLAELEAAVQASALA